MTPLCIFWNLSTVQGRIKELPPKGISGSTLDVVLAGFLEDCWARVESMSEVIDLWLQNPEN
jgi:hypothetical protein